MRGLTLISRANNDSLSSLQWLINKPSIKWPNSLHGFFQMKASHSSVQLTGTFRNNRPAVSLSTCSQNAVLALWICSHRADGDRFNEVFLKHLKSRTGKQINRWVFLKWPSVPPLESQRSAAVCCGWDRARVRCRGRLCLCPGAPVSLVALSVRHPSVCDNCDRLERDSTSIPLGWDRLILPETCVLVWMCVCAYLFFPPALRQWAWVYIYLCICSQINRSILQTLSCESEP